MKRRLRDATSNPGDYTEMVADQNQNEWRKNPDERSMGFFNPVPLGSVSPFMLRKQMKEAVDELPSMSRRDFMKKSAGLAAGSTVGAGVTAKLLRKFAPEERAIAKEVAVEAAPKYKYNSLKEYLDDVSTRAEGDILMSGNKWDDSLWQKDMKERLLQDEARYLEAKDIGGREYQAIREAFSPQAKKEMKALKEYADGMNTGRYPRPEDTSIYQHLEWADPKSIETFLKEVPF